MPGRGKYAGLLDEAARACFFLGVDDMAERLCAANMPYGIAKIRYIQARHGITPDACFVGAPDATITRNIDRWQAGFGYGGRIRFSGDFSVLSVKSNCCGIYLGGLSEIPAPADVLSRIKEVQNNLPQVSGTPLSWDFGKSNHFISVVQFDNEVEGHPYGVVIHGSGPELRNEGEHGAGLYFDRSETLGRIADKETTPWGDLLVLRGAALDEYWRGYLEAERISRARRKVIADLLFPGIAEISNTIHQGASAPNDVHLGCLVDTGDTPVPLVLKAELPVPIIRCVDNLSPEVVESLGFTERAEGAGLLERLTGANLLPHGGGYGVAGYERIAEIIEEGSSRLYVMETEGANPARVYHRNFRNIPFYYRGEEVLHRLEELRLGEVVALGLPRFEFLV